MNFLVEVLNIVMPSGQTKEFLQKGLFIPEPKPIGSYSPDDVIFLLKDIGGLIEEQDNEERERLVQNGCHYSEMLPIEYWPNTEYIELFYQSLKETSVRIAHAVGLVAMTLLKDPYKKIVLVSLARAGTPAGILIKRYIKLVSGINLPHYSISIIRDKGIDENALLYILRKHPECKLQFIDGWTGKGVIAGELRASLKAFREKYAIEINSSLAVLADPGYCAGIFGTREDFLIPSACLNATVSGLVSRTVFRKDLIGDTDFHGAKFYSEMADEDLSNYFIDAVSGSFALVREAVSKTLEYNQSAVLDNFPSFRGLRDIERIKEEYGIGNINYIKPGVGETTRVLLRRVPWKVLVKDAANPDLKHIFLLAEERGVSVECCPDMSYSCCGLVKTVVDKK
jgi:hypothetical protein